MTALALLEQIAALILRFVPIVKIAKPTLHYVAFCFGSWPDLLTDQNGWFGTGLHVVWPLIMPVEEYEVHIVPVDIPEQSCTTADGHSVNVDGVAYAKVVDPIKVALTVPEEHWTRYAEDLAAGVTRELIQGEDWDVLLDLDLQEGLFDEMKVRLDEIGIRLTCVKVRSFQRVRAFGHWGISGS